MNEYFVLFLIMVLALAAVLREDFVFTLFYFIIGAYVFSRWWSNQAQAAITIERIFVNRAFLNDKVTIRLELHNTSRLPVVWVRLHDSVPVEIASAEALRRIISIGSRSKHSFEYVLQPGHRGYYQIGPVFLYSGDILGLSSETARQGALDHLTVYPRIIPFSRVDLPSRSPMGTLRHHQPLFEDPTRVRGKRDYVAGDSLRRVDWKATAITGRMQVKLLEPSIALETVIYLNLHGEDYYYRGRIDATELGIVVAASLANWVTSKKQTVGFATNGIDLLAADGNAALVPPEKGRAHLMRILDVLARIQLGETTSFTQMLQRDRVRLAWGTTVVLITGNADNALFDEMFQMKRAGMNVVLILCGHVIEAKEIKRRAQHFSIPVHQFMTEQDLDIWRR